MRQDLFVFNRAIHHLKAHLMQFRSRFFDLLFNLAQSKTVSPTLIPIDFIVDDMKVETVVSGDLVQRFVTKTYNILRQQENFFTKINLHIIQCDAEVQEDRKITSQKDFDNYLDTMQLHGFGGTDFRPVFQYVDELVRAGAFTNLKGMIYFTDGRGIFPEKKPDYDAAFVFLDDGYDPPDVPVWAIKLVLQSEEI